MVFFGIPDAQVGNQLPFFRDTQTGIYARSIENRDPTQPQSVATRGQPQGIHRQDRGVFQGLGHGHSAQTAATLCLLVQKYRDMNRSIAQAG